MTEQKKRARPKPRRFATLKEGDIIVRVFRQNFAAHAGAQPETREYRTPYIVTDEWFDPVYGQEDPDAGRMFAVAKHEEGKPPGRKFGYSVRALAQDGFHWPEDLAKADAKRAAVDAKPRRGSMADHILRERDG